MKKKNEKFKDFLEEKRNLPECRLTSLEGFLIKPVQRISKSSPSTIFQFSYRYFDCSKICKYPLLVRELIKNSPKDDSQSSSMCFIVLRKCLSLISIADISQLESALAKIETVVAIVNENKRKSENSAKIFEIQRQIEAGESLQLLTPTRRFLMEGKLPELTDDRLEVAGECHYFAFNDIVLRTKKSKNIRKKHPPYRVETVLPMGIRSLPLFRSCSSRFL